MTAQARLLGGRYQVGELLGYGGMAEVHRGRDLRLGRDVAIKMLRTDLARDDTFQLRFRREAQNAASLNHPAIVAVYDTGEERGPAGESLPYIVMEFVNGRTLKEVLAAEGRLMPRRALEITAEICSALEFSHRHNIIHRDIKPGNVMLTQTGQVKVMDFGIARALAGGAATMTQTSAVIGTAQYLSPEQARGEAVDARSDVYATGCVLYELLCSHPPFVGDSPVSVAYQHVREDARPPSESNRDVPAAIDAIVLKALAKNPLNRYQSAAEMRADLLRAAAGRPVYAEPVLRETELAHTTAMRSSGPARTATGARVGQARRRRTSGWAIGALVALAVLAATAITAGLILVNQHKTVLVPRLVGQNREQAAVLLSSAGLKAQATARTGATCAVNTVLDQNPAPNSRVNPDSTVEYFYCAGPAQVVVPPLVSLPKDNAEQQLKDKKLTWKEVPQHSDKAAGTVLAQDPAAGKTVAENTVVTLTVSLGDRRLMPNVSDGSLDENGAMAVLRNAGLTHVEAVPRDTNNPAEIGKVIGQDPDPNTLVNPNEQITIYVGKAPEPTGPPTSPPPS
jgi:eukaryotic-like serine/threonine-protein kinase